MRRRLAAVALVATIGCEWDYGVNRGTELAAIPASACVSKAVRGTDGVTSVEEHHSESFHRYRYEGEEFWAYIAFREEAGGGVSFLNTRISVNRRPSDQEVATTRRMMRAVEKAIASECGVPELEATVFEECVGIDCEEG
jgi:hypothetical protein